MPAPRAQEPPRSCGRKPASLPLGRPASVPRSCGNACGRGPRPGRWDDPRPRRSLAEMLAGEGCVSASGAACVLAAFLRKCLREKACAPPLGRTASLPPPWGEVARGAPEGGLSSGALRFRPTRSCFHSAFCPSSGRRAFSAAPGMAARTRSRRIKAPCRRLRTAPPPPGAACGRSSCPCRPGTACASAALLRERPASLPLGRPASLPLSCGRKPASLPPPWGRWRAARRKGGSHPARSVSVSRAPFPSGVLLLSFGVLSSSGRRVFSAAGFPPRPGWRNRRGTARNGPERRRDRRPGRRIKFCRSG